MKTNNPEMKSPWNKKLSSLAALSAACVALIMPAQADSYATIAGSGDAVIIQAGETALVMAGAGTISYAKKGKACSYIRLSSNRKTTLRETSHQVIPLAGPCVITVRSCDGYLGMRIVATGVRPVTKRSQALAGIRKGSEVRP